MSGYLEGVLVVLASVAREQLQVGGAGGFAHFQECIAAAS